MEVLEAERGRLLDFAEASLHPAGGFAWLDDRGRPRPERGLPTYLTARMTHVFALGALEGRVGADALAAHGVDSLRGPLLDAGYGGWCTSLSAGLAPSDPSKRAYTHAFVVLAAGSAAAAGVPGAADLFDVALDLMEKRFLDAEGRVVDGYDRAFTSADTYRGANSSMHTVEALLVAGDVRGEPRWHDLALGIAGHLVHDVARAHRYRLPEHYSTGWEALPDYNRDSPLDQFRPYGSTPGHLLEWSRLLLHLEASLAAPPSWLLADSVGLFDGAVESGWDVDGRPGFVYTTDWEDRPVVRSRMHWVQAEAIAAASALHRRTREPAYDAWFRTWWDFAEQHMVDRELGSWHHELDETNRPAATVWYGKPDVYHAYQAALLPRCELSPSLAVQLARAATSA